MEQAIEPDPRDLDLATRIRRLAAWGLGSDRGRRVTIADLIAGEGEDPALIARRILRTDNGTAELANLLRRARLDGEPCPDPEGWALAIVSGVRNGAETPADRLALALILIPGAIAGLGLAGGLDLYLAFGIVAAGWYLGWRLLRRAQTPGHDEK